MDKIKFISNPILIKFCDGFREISLFHSKFSTLILINFFFVVKDNLKFSPRQIQITKKRFMIIIIIGT
jgi:hypothetical protein